MYRLNVHSNKLLFDGVIECTSAQFQAFGPLSRILLAVSTQVSNDLLDLQQATKDIPVVALPWLPQIHIPTKD